MKGTRLLPCAKPHDFFNERSEEVLSSEDIACMQSQLKGRKDKDNGTPRQTERKMYLKFPTNLEQEKLSCKYNIYTNQNL